MFDVFEKYMLSHVDLTREELSLMESAAISRSVRKKQFLNHEGQVFPYKCFVLKGCLKFYRLREEGTEHIIRFVTENAWIADSESFHFGKPSKYNIDAIDDSELLLWTKPVFEELTERIPQYRLFSDRIMARSMDASQNRIFSNISATAEEKYNGFLDEFPGLASRLPLHMIASYLGVSRETLSRVKNSAARIKSR